MRLAYIIAIPVLLIPFGQPTGEASSSVSLGESPIDTFTIEIASKQPTKPKVKRIHKSANLPKTAVKTIQVKKSEANNVKLTKSASKNIVEQKSSTKQTEAQSSSAEKQTANSGNQNSQADKPNDKPENQNPDRNIESSPSYSKVIYSESRFIDVEHRERNRNVESKLHE